MALTFAGGPLDRAWLATALWPDVPDAVAGTNLRRHVAYVEQWLRAFTGCSTPIVRDGRSLRLEPSLVEWIDVRAFEDALAKDAFEEAAGIYGGDLLLDLDDEWIVPHRTRLRAAYDDALSSLVESARSRNAFDVALRHTLSARGLDPYDEAWLRTEMRVRFGAGDRAGAIRAFDAYRALVASDLDLEPVTETVMLADSIRRLEPEAAPAATPFEATSFVGRVEDERALCRLIVNERLVTVSGEPGIGKSRLTVRCVRALAADVRDGAIVVDAGSASDADGLGRALIRALDASGKNVAGETAEDALSRLDAIVLLDGCERIASACAAFASRMLATPGTIRIVASSRVALGAPGEALLRLGPLNREDSGILFAERVRLARAEVALSASDAKAVTRVSGKLGGLPLAIELAAARARTSTLEDVDRDVRGYASRPGRDVLYAAYESSFEVLGDVERATLRRLAAFENGWSSAIALEACAGIAGADELIAAFSTLVEHSLIVPPGIAQTGARYYMLDATRDFARYRSRTLGETESDAHATAVAVARAYARIGRRLRAEHAADYYPELQRDHENIQAALTTLWCGDRPDRELAVDASLAISRFWVDQGFAREGEAWLRKALAEPASGDAQRRLELLRVIGTLTRDLGDYATSYRDFAELVHLHETERSNPVEIAKAQTMAANAARMMANFDEALDRTRTACAAFSEAGEAYFAAWAVYALGTTYLSAGRFGEAALELERATGMFNDAGAVADSSSSIANLALCHYYEGRFEIALELTRESVARASTAGHRYYYAHAILNEALVLLAQGTPSGAWARIVEAGAIGLGLGSHDIFISCAEVAASFLAERDPATAALLAGSVDATRERARAPRFPVDLPLYERLCSIVRTALGDERWEASRIRGRLTPLRDAIARLETYEPGLTVTT